ncbi:ATP-dependent RNA helicase [Nocardia sp. MW-W600-9]
MKLPELPDLPVRPALAEIVETLVERGVAVLVAPPGTGKTTLVPLALVAGTEGKVVVAEPRRLAARAAAARMAALLGEKVGDSVGYSVRGDRKVGPRTRIEVVTSGLLVRRLQSDPELDGVGTVVLDECHERHLDADLLLALLLDARSGLRPDLRVLATSATVAAGRLAVLLGSEDALPGSAAPSTGSEVAALDGGPAVWTGDDPVARTGAAGSGAAPVVEVRGRAYPVEVGYVPALARERVEAQVARATRRALAETEGDVLVFLPGVGEINRTAGLLRDLDGVDVVPLHGRLGSSVQDVALRPGTRRRVVLSTAVAESSLTVPGVRAVVDSGLSRVPRIDHRRGLSGLATVRVSAAVAEQRAGRAGREAPGHAWRCWPEYEHQTLPAYPEPEIRTAELTRLALELACWGTPDGTGLTWWDAPPEGGLAAGRAVLRALGALDDADHITDRGRAMAAVGLHPRLARALLDGATHVGARAAAEMVVLMDDDSLASGVDAAAALRALRAERPPRWTREIQRLVRLIGARDVSGGSDENRESAARGRPEEGRAGSSTVEDRLGGGGAGAETADGGEGAAATGGVDAGTATAGHVGAEVSGDDRRGVVSSGSVVAAGSAALLIALAHPERLARRRANGASYLMAGGTAVTLPPGSGLAAAEWLAVAVADRDPGRAEGRIRLAAIADEDLARAAAPGSVTQVDEVRWESGDVVARRVERLGAIVLSEKALREPDSRLLEEAVRAGLRSEGLDLLRWDEDARGLRQRLDFLHRTLGAPWPAVDDDTLLADLELWLGPELATARRRSDLARVEAGTALRRLLPWSKRRPASTSSRPNAWRSLPAAASVSTTAPTRRSWR